MSDDGTHGRTDGLSRREWLAMAGTGAAGALAGCSQGEQSVTTSTSTSTSEGGGDETTTESGGGGATQMTDRALQMPIRDPPTEFNVNPKATNGGDGTDILMAKTADFSWTDYEYFWMDLEPDSAEVDTGADEFRMTFRDDVYWHRNGENIDPLTAEDWRLQEKLNRLMIPEDARNYSPVESRHVEGKNDKTYVAKLKGEEGYNNLSVLDGQIRLGSVWMYRDGPLVPKLEALEEATSTDEKDKVRTEITKVKMPLEETAFSGIWHVDKSGAGRIFASLNEDHWVAKERDWNFKKLNLKYLGEWGKAGLKIYQAFTKNELDLQHNFNKPNAVKFEDVPDNIGYYAVPPNHGDGFIVNGMAPVEEMWRWKDDPKENFEVTGKIRQGLAYALPTERARKNAYQGNPRFPKPGRCTGIGGGQAQGIFDQETYETFPQFEVDHEKAAARFREAGCTKDNGQWYDPNGNVAKLTMEILPWYNQVLLTLADGLESFGLKVEKEAKSGSQLSNAFWGTREYHSFIVNYGELRPPSEAFEMNLNPPARGSTPGDRTGAPDEFMVPKFGDLAGDPVKTVNAREFAAIQEKTSEDKLAEWYQDIAWIFATHAIVVPLLGRGYATTVNEHDFKWPDHPTESPSLTTADHPPSWSGTRPYQSLHRGHDGPPVAEPK